MIIHTIKGEVQEGKKRGKRLGYPTINFPITDPITEGVYISQTTVAKEKYNSLTFIGTARTFNESIFQAETYILNYNKDIYGQSVTVDLIKKLRDNQKFNTEGELIAQMNEDKKQAKEFFKQ